MMDGINGGKPLSPTEQSQQSVSQNTPPSGSPAGAPAVAPDVAVAISQLAQSRMAAMMAPASEAEKGNAMWNADRGGMDFGVDKGGFDWPLDAGQEATAAASKFDSQSMWTAASEAVNGVVVDDSNESAYIALGKTALSDGQ